MIAAADDLPQSLVFKPDRLILTLNGLSRNVFQTIRA